MIVLRNQMRQMVHSGIALELEFRIRIRILMQKTEVHAHSNINDTGLDSASAYSFALLRLHSKQLVYLREHSPVLSKIMSIGPLGHK